MMHKLAAAALLVALLPACVGGSKFWQPPTEVPRTMTLEIVKAERLAEIEVRHGHVPGQALGLAVWTIAGPKKCNIYILQGLRISKFEEILVHEIRHCWEGQFHK